LANILNNIESWQTDTFAVEEVLVDTAWIATNTSLLQIFVIIAFFALATDTVDGVEAVCAIAVAGVGVEHFVDTTPVAFGLVTILYLYGWSAVDAVL
jgi:uncharacterized protein YebE (UPF0316 family)